MLAFNVSPLLRVLARLTGSSSPPPHLSHPVLHQRWCAGGLLGPLEASSSASAQLEVPRYHGSFTSVQYGQQPHLHRFIDYSSVKDRQGPYLHR